MRTILHVDFNSYFATVEQQANPRLRGKPVGVTGGDRMKRTVLGAASVEAKKFGVKTGMQIWEARKLCPQIILVAGDSDKYLEVTKRFLNILKDYSPYLEVFSIDECFLELPHSVIARSPRRPRNDVVKIALSIKSRIQTEIGEWITCSIGISYNKIMAKLAGSLYKPDGLVMIEDQKAASFILDRVPLDEICGIGGRIKARLNKLGIFNFKQLRAVPLNILLFEFKSYGKFLYDAARGIDYSKVLPFYEKEEVKSIGHRHTISYDTADLQEIKQILLKLSEMIAARLRAKNLLGKTVHCWYRNAIRMHNPGLSIQFQTGIGFSGDGMQTTVSYTADGLEIFKAAWKIFHQIWTREKIRMIGASISNLKPKLPQNLSLLPETNKQEKIVQTIDKINNKFGEFTLQRGILLTSSTMRRKPNPFLSDRRFKL